jgi:hypothetical protein
MKKRFLYGTAVFFLPFVTLVFGQGSFDFGNYGPSTSSRPTCSGRYPLISC